MSFSTLAIESDGYIVTPTFHDDLLEALRVLRQDAEARAIVITANGRAFSGGGHMTELFGQYKDIDVAMRNHQRAREITSQFLDIPAPVVCAVQGPATGLGASIALLSDFLIMAEGSRLIDPHVRAGLVAGDGGTLVFPLAMSMQQAKKHLLLCRPLLAEDALKLGIALEVVGADQLEATALEVASELASLPPLAVRHTKQALNAHLRSAAPYTVELAGAWEHVMFRTSDHQEAIASFIEKRPPVYQGR
jgi:enoyl-CoA hydratase